MCSRLVGPFNIFVHLQFGDFISSPAYRRFPHCEFETGSSFSLFPVVSAFHIFGSDFWDRKILAEKKFGKEEKEA